MIMRLSEGVSRIALKVRDVGTQRILTDWRMLQLLIQPGQYDVDCGPNGSPWFLHGCWPMHPTGVDIANYRHDFPTLCYNADELDPDGRVVFGLDHRLWELPKGRYSGILRLYPHGRLPVNLRMVHDVHKRPAPKGIVIPEEYKAGEHGCSPEFPRPVPHPKPPKCCILYQFDIDLGPLCSDHIVDSVAADFAINYCGEM